MTITYIYLRHGPKEYRNGRAMTGKPQHDSPIMGSCIPRCREVGQFLIDKYGAPNMVVMSPYLRTRQTAQELIHPLKYKREELKSLFYIDNNIAEFLGHQRGSVDVTEETLNYSSNIKSTESRDLPSTQETMDSLIKRIENHLLMMQVLRQTSSPNEEDEKETSTPSTLENCSKVVWIVTHGIVIDKIYKVLKEHDFRGCKASHFYPDELQGLAVEIDDVGELVSFVYPETPTIIRVPSSIRHAHHKSKTIVQNTKSKEHTESSGSDTQGGSGRDSFSSF